jgi:Tfp pilus assembly protein PilZ
MANDSIRNGRQDPRVSYRDPVQVSLIGHPEQVRYLLAEDLSVSGLMLFSAEPYPLHARLLMDIEPAAESEPIRLIGQVVWYARVDRQERYRMGVQLIEVDDVTKERLRELVAARAQAIV